MDFGVFLEKITYEHLKNNKVVCIKDFGYLFLVAIPGRDARNPVTGEKIFIPEIKRLRFIDKYEGFCDFTEQEFLESLKRNKIELVDIEFPDIELIKQSVHKNERIKLQNSKGEDILQIQLVRRSPRDAIVPKDTPITSDNNVFTKENSSFKYITVPGSVSFQILAIETFKDEIKDFDLSLYFEEIRSGETTSGFRTVGLTKSPNIAEH